MKKKSEISSYAKRLGEKIRELRKIKGSSQEQLAEKLGISTAYLGHIERGRTEATFKFLEKVSKYFDLPASALIEEEEEIRSKNIYIRKLNRVLPKISENRLFALYELVESMTED